MRAKEGDPKCLQDVKNQSAALVGVLLFWAAGGHREHLWSWEWRILWEMLYVGKKEAYGISTPPKE